MPFPDNLAILIWGVAIYGSTITWQLMKRKRKRAENVSEYLVFTEAGCSLRLVFIIVMAVAAFRADQAVMNWEVLPHAVALPLSIGFYFFPAWAYLSTRHELLVVKTMRRQAASRSSQDETNTK